MGILKNKKYIILKILQLLTVYLILSTTTTTKELIFKTIYLIILIVLVMIIVKTDGIGYTKWIIPIVIIDILSYNHFRDIFTLSILILTLILLTVKISKDGNY